MMRPEFVLSMAWLAMAGLAAGHPSPAPYGPHLFSAALLQEAGAKAKDDEQDEADADADEDFQMDWAPGLVEAFADAPTHKQPTLVWVPAAEDTRVFQNKVLGHESLKDYRGKCQWVIASPQQHEETHIEIAGVRRSVCEAFRQISCAGHQQAWIDLQELAPAVGTQQETQWLLWTPGGELISHRLYQVTETGLLSRIKLALQASGQDPSTLAPIAAPADLEEAFKEVIKMARRESSQFSMKTVMVPFAALPGRGHLERLVKHLEDEKSDPMRAAILDILDINGEVTSLQPLLKAAQDKREYVALAAVDGLRKMRLPEAVEVLEKLLRKYPKGQSHGRVLHALAACGGHDPKVQARVLKESKGSDASSRCYGISALGYLPESDDVLKQLDRAMGDRVSRTRGAAIWAAWIGRFEGSRPFLEERLKKERVRELADNAVLAIAYLDNPLGAPAALKHVVPAYGGLEQYAPFLDPRW